MGKYDPKNDIHSRVTVTFKDDSIVKLAKPIPNNYVLFQPYFSDAGEDSVILDWTSVDDFIDKNGEPVFKRHGQHIYNAINWLSAGGLVKGLRLVADDAKYAYGIICIRTKEVTKVIQIPDPTDPSTTVDKTITALAISPTMVSIPSTLSVPKGLSPRAESEFILKALNTAPYRNGPNGWKYYYIQLWRPKGRGKYGNNYVIKYSLNSTVDEYMKESRRYYLEIYKKTKASVLSRQSNAWSVSFSDLAKTLTGSGSEYVDTIVSRDSFREECDDLYVYTYQQAYDELINSFKPYCELSDPSQAGKEFVETPSCVDFLYLIARNGTKYVRFVEPPTNDMPPEPEVDFSYTGGQLSGGSDGALDYSDIRYNTLSPDQIEEQIQSVKEDLLIRAYRGEIDEDLISPYKHQINEIIDANNTKLVKEAMQALAMHHLRQDIAVELDLGFTSNYEEAIGIMNNTMYNITSQFVSVYPQSGTAYDPYTGTNIRVTYCYELAYLLPYIRRTYGPGKLVAGTRKGLLQKMLTLDWYPREPHKTPLKKARLNYVEEVKKGQFCLASVRTAYPELYSYFAVNTNVRAMAEISYLVRNILVNYRFEDDDPNIVMGDAKSEIMANINYLKNDGPIEKIDVTVFRTATDIIENSARARIVAKFKDFIETWEVEIVAKR